MIWRVNQFQYTLPLSYPLYLCSIAVRKSLVNIINRYFDYGLILILFVDPLYIHYHSMLVSLQDCCKDTICVFSAKGWFFKIAAAGSTKSPSWYIHIASIARFLTLSIDVKSIFLRWIMNPPSELVDHIWLVVLFLTDHICSRPRCHSNYYY